MFLGELQKISRRQIGGMALSLRRLVPLTRRAAQLSTAPKGSSLSPTLAKRGANDSYFTGIWTGLENKRFE